MVTFFSCPANANIILGSWHYDVLTWLGVRSRVFGLFRETIPENIGQNMALSPIHHCAECASSPSSSKLFRCQACQVVYYCGRDHQVAHRETHKRACNEIKKTRQKLDREETKLRSHPGDFMTPTNLFEEHAGQFWGIFETRDYMRARFALVTALLKVRTYAAVGAAQAHVLQCRVSDA